MRMNGVDISYALFFFLSFHSLLLFLRVNAGDGKIDQHKMPFYCIYPFMCVCVCVNVSIYASFYFSVCMNCRKLVFIIDARKHLDHTYQFISTIWISSVYFFSSVFVYFRMHDDLFSVRIRTARRMKDDEKIMKNQLSSPFIEWLHWTWHTNGWM